MLAPLSMCWLLPLTVSERIENGITITFYSLRGGFEIYVAQTDDCKRHLVIMHHCIDQLRLYYSV